MNAGGGGYILIIMFTKCIEYLEQCHVFAIIEAAPVSVWVDERTAFLGVSITWEKREKGKMLYLQSMLLY